MTQDAPARRITPPAWLTPPLRELARLLDGGRFVGGPVRDTLLGRAVTDLDMATPLVPQEVLARLERAGIRAVPTGIDHGTVTAVLGGGPEKLAAEKPTTVEVTTLRRDIETDGRHAVVAFTTDWAEDAARRDFTMNALYLDAEAQIWDPVDGIEDCLAGRVRFIGEAAARVAEDYLRILRFYRFQAHYATAEADATARGACRAGAHGLARLSGERIRHEMMRLLAAPDPVPAFAMLVEDGIWSALDADRCNPDTDLDGFQRLVQLEVGLLEDALPDPIRRLAYLMRLARGGLANGKPADWRFSNDELDRLTALANSRQDLGADAIAARRAIWQAGKSLYRDGVLLAAARQDRAEDAARLIAIAEGWDVPALPIRGADLLALGVPPGPGLGKLLRAVEVWWIAQDFAPNRAACLAEAQRLLG